MILWTTLTVILVTLLSIPLWQDPTRTATVVTHIAVTAILFLPLTRYLVTQISGFEVTGPIILVCTVVAMGSAAISGRFRMQWRTLPLILTLAILSFRNVDEITPLTQGAISTVIPIVVLGLCVRIEVRTLLRCMAGAGVVLLLAAVLGGEFFEARLTLPGENPIWVARMACLAVLAILFTKLTQWRSINWTVAAAGAWLMWLTGSRGPMLALWSAVLVFWALRTTGRIRFLMVTGVLILSIIVNPMLSGAELPTHSGGEVSTEWRLTAWKQALELWSARPFIGYGTPVDASAVGPGTYPHNAFLELLVQTGMVGLGVFALLSWLTWRNTESAMLRSIFSAVLLFSAFSGSVWTAYELWLFALLRVSADDERSRSLPSEWLFAARRPKPGQDRSAQVS